MIDSNHLLESAASADSGAKELSSKEKQLHGKLSFMQIVEPLKADAVDRTKQLEKLNDLIKEYLGHLHEIFEI